MTPRINQAIDDLVKALREESPKQMIAFTLFVNSEESEVKTRTRTPEQLKARGVSMQNLRGEFIKDQPTKEQ
jgi:hypothetical protein